MSSTDRYAVYTPDVPKEFNRPHFLVWDRELKRPVPYGRYGKLDGAQRRAYRMNHPTGWDTGEYRLCLSCADSHCPGTGTDRAGWRPIQGNIVQSCDWCEADLTRTDKRVKHCDAFADHYPHSHGTSDLRCPGGGPFRDVELSQMQPETYPGPPCVCSDSIRSACGYCPPEGHREYIFCPVRTGNLERTEEP